MFSLIFDKSIHFDFIGQKYIIYCTLATLLKKIAILHNFCKTVSFSNTINYYHFRYTFLTIFCQYGSYHLFPVEPRQAVEIQGDAVPKPVFCHRLRGVEPPLQRRLLRVRGVGRGRAGAELPEHYPVHMVGAHAVVAAQCPDVRHQHGRVSLLALFHLSRQHHPAHTAMVPVCADMVQSGASRQQESAALVCGWLGNVRRFCALERPDLPFGGERGVQWRVRQAQPDDGTDIRDAFPLSHSGVPV